MEPTALAQYGAVGIILAALLALFVWMAKTMFTAMIEQNKALQGEQLKALEAIKTEVAALRTEVMQLKETVARTYSDIAAAILQGGIPLSANSSDSMPRVIDDAPEMTPVPVSIGAQVSRKLPTR